MTFEEFKDECYKIKSVCIERDELLREYISIEEHKYDNLVNVSDVSRDRIKTSSSPDDKVINAIDFGERKKRKVIEKMEKLPVVDEDVYELLLDSNGRGGVIVFTFFIIHVPINVIAEGLELSPKHCYSLMREELKRLYQIYNEK